MGLCRGRLLLSGEDEKSLQDEMRGYLDKGYSTVKMKVGGVPLKEDLKRIEAVLKILGGNGDKLCVDVNGRFDLDEAIAFGDAIAPYKLHWYEEPVDPLDYLLHAALATRYQGPLATGENLFSMQDARNLIRHGGLRPDRDWLQFDPALSYGLVVISPHAGDAAAARLVVAALRPAWRASVRAQHRRRARPSAATNPIRRCSRRSVALPTTCR